MNTAVSIQPISNKDKAWVDSFMIEHWGATSVVSRGVVHEGSSLAGFFALYEDKHVGLVTYHIVGNECEIVSLDSTRPSLGIGTALIQAVVEVARREHCTRIWLITTNDNLHALGFYQRRGFVLAALHRNAIEASRRIKPEIPLVGNDGIPIRDEIELELLLN